MRTNLNISVIFFALLITIACNKEEDGPYLNEVFKIIPNADRYNARSIFQGSDGAVYIALNGNENEERIIEYGTRTSKLYKYTTQGDLMWERNLPGEVYNLWKALPLANGNILIVGMDSTSASQNIGMCIFDTDGFCLKKKILFNQFDPFPGAISPGKLDVIELKDTRIALAVESPFIFSGGYRTQLKMIFLDSQLELLNTIEGDGILSPEILNVSEGANNEIYTVTSSLNFSQVAYEGIYLVKFNPNTSMFDTLFIDLTNHVNTSNLTALNQNEIVWASVYPIGGHNFNLRNQESYSHNDTLNIWKWDIEGQVLETITITTFSRSGYLAKVKSLESGGLIAIGTSNLTTDAVNNSTQVFLLKLNANLDVEWSKEISGRETPLIGQDIIEVAGGYQILATTFSINEFHRPVTFSVDLDGNLY